MAGLTVRASASNYVLSDGNANTIITFPGTPQPGDPIGIWFTTDDNTKIVSSPPVGWTLEYSTAVGTGSRTFLHKVYQAGDGTSVTVAWNAGRNYAYGVIVFDGSKHSDFGTLGTITTRAASSTTTLAKATGTSANPNLIVSHEKTTNQTTITPPAGVTTLLSQLPSSTHAGSLYLGTYDDSAGPVDQTITYGGTANLNGAAYQVPVTLVPAGTNTGSASGGVAWSASVTGTRASSGTSSARGKTVSQWLASTPMYVAHRGGSADWPEEVLWSYQQAAARNPDLALEISVWRTADGVWVCSHDQTTGRVFGTNLDITTSNWADLAALRTTVGGYPIAKLTDILAQYAGERVLFVENKGAQANSTFLDLLDSYGGPNWIVVKTSGNGVSIPQAALARGYQVWGYFFPADTAAGNLNASSAANFTLLGIEWDDTSAVWAQALSYGKPVLGHIIANQQQATAATTLGASGLMVSGVLEVVPAVGQRTPTVTWTATASGTAPAVAAGGTATSSVTWTGNATGTTSRSGTAAGAVTWTVSAAGSSADQRAITVTASLAYTPRFAAAITYARAYTATIPSGRKFTATLEQP